MQVFSCEYREIFKNTFFYRTPQVAASVKNMCEKEIGLPFINPFYTNVPLLYPLKTSEKTWFSQVFRG